MSKKHSLLDGFRRAPCLVGVTVEFIVNFYRLSGTIYDPNMHNSRTNIYIHKYQLL